MPTEQTGFLPPPPLPAHRVPRRRDRFTYSPMPARLALVPGEEALLRLADGAVAPGRPWAAGEEDRRMPLSSVVGRKGCGWGGGVPVRGGIIERPPRLGPTP